MLTMQGRLHDALQQLTVSKTVAPDLPKVVDADATRLIQVLSNLLSNAARGDSSNPFVEPCHDQILL